MSEQNTIPAEMLDAVRPIAERMSESSLTPGYDGGCSGLSEDEAMGWLEAALQAAGVPALRERIAELEAELGEANLIAEARSVVGMDLLAEADQQEARIAELEAALRKIVHSQDVAMPIEFDEEIAELLKPMGAGGEQ